MLAIVFGRPPQVCSGQLPNLLFFFQNPSSLQAVFGIFTLFLGKHSQTDGAQVHGSINEGLMGREPFGGKVFRCAGGWEGADPPGRHLGNPAAGGF